MTATTLTAVAAALAQIAAMPRRSVEDEIEIQEAGLSVLRLLQDAVSGTDLEGVIQEAESVGSIDLARTVEWYEQERRAA